MRRSVGCPILWCSWSCDPSAGGGCISAMHSNRFALAASLNVWPKNARRLNCLRWGTKVKTRGAGGNTRDIEGGERDGD